MDNHQQPVCFAQRLLSYLVCILIAGQPVFPAFAAPTPADNATKMDRAGNGVPVVNIATPNGAGISHNKFQQYNVGQEGLILNNATGQLNQTQLGGLIPNNPHLKAGQEARGIINEVTGANRSQLQGYTEVAGKAANVMVANPYGITCNGCGFINTPNVTLTTGKPVFDAAGNLQQLDVTKGSITIEGKGLNASRSDALSIIARATEVNAEIHAKNLNVIAGANRVDAGGNATAIAGDGAVPVVAVDTGALGGMYANRIHLVSSEKGVGVNLGDLNAREGDITLDTSGKLTVKNSLTSGNLTAQGLSVVLNGEHKASGNVSVSAQKDVTVNGATLVSDNEISLAGEGKLTLSDSKLTVANSLNLSGAQLDLDSSSRADAGRNITANLTDSGIIKGQLVAGENLSVRAQALTNSGTLAANGNGQLIVGNLANHGTLQSQKNLSVEGSKLRNDGEVLSEGELDVVVQTLEQNGTMSAQKRANITASHQLANSGAGQILSEDVLTVRAGTLRQNGMLSGKNALTVNSNTLSSGDSSRTLSQGDISLHADSANLGGQVIARGDLNAQAKQFTSRADSQMQSDAALTLKAREISLNGTQAAKTELNVTADTLIHSGKSSAKAVRFNAYDLTNSGALVAPELVLTGNTLTNSGLLQGDNALDLSSGRLINQLGGTLYSAQNLTLSIPDIANAGLITTDAGLVLSGDSLINSGEINGTDILASMSSFTNQSAGRLLADESFSFKGLALDNAGEIAAKGLTVDSNSVANTGTIQGDSSLTLLAKTVENDGNLLTGGNLTLKAYDVNNSGHLQATELVLTLANAFINANTGTVNAGKTLQVTTPSLSNFGLMSSPEATFNAVTLNNAGTLQGANLLTLETTTFANQTGSVLLSGGEIALKANSLSNAGLLQGKTLNLATGDWINTGNALSEQNATLHVTRTLNNQGKILGQQGLALSVSSLDNRGWLAATVVSFQGDLINSGLIQGGNSLTLEGNTVINAVGGKLLTDGMATVRNKHLQNHGVLQGKSLLIATDEWNNSGQAQAQDVFTANVSGALTNSGTLLGQHDLTVQAINVANSGNLAAKNLKVTASALTNSGLLQGNAALQLFTPNINNSDSGQIISGGGLTLALDNLDNAGLLQVNDDFSLTSSSLSNDGTLAANSVVIKTDAVTNKGVLQGNNGLSIDSLAIANQNGARILSDGNLLLRGGTASNDGTWQGKTLDFNLASLDNRGTLNGIDAFSGTTSGELINSGQLWSQGKTRLQAGLLGNSGKITADSLTLEASQLTNDGLWQGANGLTVTGDTLIAGSNSRTLSGGLLALEVEQLTTGGILQGKTVNVAADSWTHSGSLLGQENVDTSVSGTFINKGELLSQKGMQVSAQTLTNTGSLLSENEMRLAGNQLDNSGALQGENLKLNQAKISNTGTVIGLRSLTFEAQQALAGRMLMAAPLLEMVNGNGGKLLTQGALSISGGTIINNGSWQGQSVLLNAQQLQNYGAIQSAGALALTLSGDLTSSAGSKITAGGNAAMQALNLTNNGQWLAKNLSLKGTTLNNNGAVSGVDGLTVALNGTFTQQQDKTLLSAGKLALDASAVNNQGRLQAGSLDINTGALTNSGRLQGESSLTLNLAGALTNNAAGTILSQKNLTVTTPDLFNFGVIQGGTSTRIGAINSTRNDGKILSGADLTLNAATLANNGWLQAGQLVLNATTAANSGTLLADGQSTLAGNILTNSGTLQGGNLAVNYQQLNNSGTVQGNSGLNITTSQVNHQANGKLFSGGNLVLTSAGFDQLGQVVSLGNLTLNLANAFTGKNVLAAGNILSVSSSGDIENTRVMQGQGVNLSAGGVLTNSGQITTGTSASALSGSHIAMNSAGTLQAGGDVSLTSRSDIAINGFTGTSGSLTLNAAGNIVNAALLYAGNNMSLFANSIRNQRGDILAGNSLWMQRDAAGNANAEVVNTSGSIETQRGDITIKTGHLRNERAGLSINSHEKNYPDAIPSNSNHLHGLNHGHKTPNFEISLEEWKSNGDQVVFRTWEHCVGGFNDRCHTNIQYRLSVDDTRRFLLSESVVQVSATGGAARIAAGRDINVNAQSLENKASNILAGRNITLTGGRLNNLSAVGGRKIEYVEAEYRCEWFYSDCGSNNWQQLDKLGGTSWYLWDQDQLKYRSWVPYLLGEHKSEFTADGIAFRSVIQAGGNVTANFTNDISNTTTTANTGGISSTISAPSLNTLSNQSIGGGIQKQNLVNGDSVAVNSPQWNDGLQNALHQINGGSGLDNVAENSVGLVDYSPNGEGNSNLGSNITLQNSGFQGAELTPGAANGLKPHQPSSVDTSAYPLPSDNNGYFVTAMDPKSPYLITLNPKLNGLGELDQNLFGDLHALLGIKPGEAPRETNSAYTDQNKVIGSSYFLERLNLHPEHAYRFLGDAAFDTRYVSNYVLNQTGNRYINGVGSDLEQMQYLMDNAANVHSSLGLQFGVALTAAQIAALDHSLLWWEAATVNGQTVMIPRVYLSPKDVTVNNGSVITGNHVQLAGGNITNSGSTLTANNSLSLDSQNSRLINAGGNLQLGALGDINNVGSMMAGKTVLLESVDGNINNITLVDSWSLGSGSKNGRVDIAGTQVGNVASITSLDSLSLSAGKDIAVTGANVAAGGNLLINAWGDIAVTANQVSDSYSQSGFRGKEATSNTSVTHQGSSITAGGNLAVKAGNDATVEASAVKAGGNALLSAGHDLNLLAAASTDSSSSKSKNKVIIDESVRQQGTEIASGGNTTMIAGRDINSEAAQVTASGDIGLSAGRDINLTTATESDYHFKEETKTKKGFLSKKTTHTIEEDRATREAGTLLSGDNVTLSAGNNLLVQGSSVVGDGDVSLSAGKNVDIVAATHTDSTYRLNETKKSGLMGTGGIGLTVGSSKSRHEVNEDGTTQSQSVSTVGSTGGNVSVKAGGQAHIGGSDIIAGKDMSITGDSVVMDPGHDKHTRDETFEQKQSGLTLALSGVVGSAINSAVTAAQSAKGESDGRLAALQATKAVLSGVQASQGAELAQVSGDPNNGMGVSLSLTTQKSKSQQHQQSDTVTGSTLNAGNNLSIAATGKGSSEHSGDIATGGSQLKAGGNTTLDAAKDIALIGAVNTQQSSGKNSSSGGGVGISIGGGSGGAGISIFANVNAAKGKEKGNVTAWTETTVDSGKTVTINSGRDTVLNGAQVSGDKVVVDVGRDLLISSQQDNNDYDSKQTSVAAGGSFTFGSMSGSGYINASQDKMKSRFDSVQEQSGIYAGKGGFDITAGNHTQLDGAVIASTATADKNQLDTGTLGFSNLHNEADFKTQHSSHAKPTRAYGYLQLLMWQLSAPTFLPQIK